MIDVLREIALKLWQFGKLAIPGVAALEATRWLIPKLFGGIKDWLLGLWESAKARILEQYESLDVDLAPPPEFAAWVAKINVIIPLSEMWFYLLLYLAIASVLVGIKWLRNLIPSWS